MRTTLVTAALVAGLAGPALAQQPPVQLERFGSFHVGGREVVVSGQPVREVLFSPGGVPARVDPNGTYLMGAMYANYMIPANPRGQAPVLLWHGGGLSGVSWETTPDGREGWQHFFVRRGWPVYVSDAVERGRAGWTMIPEQTGGQAMTLTVDNPFERFRIGAGAGSFARGETLPGNQFPADRDSYMNFMRQIVPRFTTTDALSLDAYLALLDRVGPSVVVAHSQAGLFGWRAAQERPDKVRALVLVEPAAIGDPAKIAALRDVPVLMIYGDYIAQDSRWPTIRGNGVRFAEQVRAAGGSVDVVDLPEIGIRGNSHMIMMDRNSDQVAGVVQDWLQRRGLYPLSDRFALAGRIALVTGASGGLGRHFGRVLHEAGASVALAARRPESVGGDVAALGSRAMTVALDVTDAVSIAAALDAVESRFGAPDLLVNNAGIAATKPFLEVAAAEWDAVMDVDLRGAFAVAQEAARRMVAAGKGGTIINIASIGGTRVIPGVAAYTAAKAGLLHLTRQMAVELARHRIRVNALAPGYVETDINRGFFASEAGQAMVKRIPQRRIGTPEDLTGALLLLASEAGEHMTGSVITVDGGHSINSL